MLAALSFLMVRGTKLFFVEQNMVTKNTGRSDSTYIFEHNGRYSENLLRFQQDRIPSHYTLAIPINLVDGSTEEVQCLKTTIYKTENLYSI